MITKDFSIFTEQGIVNEACESQFYFLPHPMLRQYVSHYTFSYSVATPNSGEPYDIVIVPDGSGCFVYIFDDSGLIDKCWGPTTQPVVVQKRVNDINERSFFIEFAPGGINAILGVNCKEIIDKRFRIKELNNSIAEKLREIVVTAKTINQIVAGIDLVLLNIVIEKQFNHNVLETIDIIKRKSGICSVKELSESTFISERHLNRLFKNHTGLSLKKFSRLTRLNKTINLYKSRQFNTSSAVAQQLGFFDESHLIKDFKEFCSTTPKNYLENMSEFYNEPFKY